MTKQRIQYQYDAVGNRRGMTDPDGGRFTYAYDSLNRIAHLENPQAERTSYAYDANGRRTVKKLANGSRASFSYDAASNLTRLANLKAAGTTISSFDYRYDQTGNRMAVREADGSRVTWSYDDAYQLTGEHRSGSNAYRNTFTYDAAGTRYGPPAIWDDSPGVGPEVTPGGLKRAPAGNVSTYCPLCRYNVSRQDFEVCAIGVVRGIGVRREIIGCVSYGHVCSFVYRQLESRGRSTCCKIKCSVVPYGAGDDKPGGAPKNSPVDSDVR